MAGGTAGTLWVKIMVAGCVGVAAAMALEHFEAGPHWLTATLLALGGLAVVFGSCEAMIKCVEGVAQRMRLNKFVAGTMAGLASNIPAPPLQLRGIDEAGVSNRRPELRGVRLRAPLDSGDHEW